MDEILRRVPHPIQSYEQFRRNRQHICDVRGYCGPFINEAYYDAFPGWQGYGDCLLCGSTTRVSTAIQADADSPAGIGSDPPADSRPKAA